MYLGKEVTAVMVKGNLNPSLKEGYTHCVTTMQSIYFSKYQMDGHGVWRSLLFVFLSASVSAN